MNICSSASEHMFMCQRTYVRGHLNLCSYFLPNFSLISTSFLYLNIGRLALPAVPSGAERDSIQSAFAPSMVRV